MNAEKPRPPYAKYAFSNPYNYALLSGVGAAAAMTGNWWLAIAGAGLEAIWMLFAPDSRLLRKAWFDKRFEEEQAQARKLEMDEKAKSLPKPEWVRWCAIVQKQEQINQLARQNPAFTVELLSGELKKLDDLVGAFLDLSVTCSRYEDYLGSIAVDEIERDLRRYQNLLEHETGEKRTLAQKNVVVLTKRKEKYGEIHANLSSARGQLELIENTFRLLADQIVTMRSPQELSGQLDELLDGVEAVRQTTRETEHLLQPA